MINVEPGQNMEIGTACWQRREEYRVLIPGILEWLLSQAGWFEYFSGNVAENIDGLRKKVCDLSNGTRVASNWALNAFGFELFVRYSEYLGVIDEHRSQDMMAEYRAILENFIEAQAGRLMLRDPVELFFQVLSQKIATNAVQIKGLVDHDTGRIIGKTRNDSNIVCLFPDPTLEIIHGHFRSVGQRLPFTKETLRSALEREALIIRSGPGRVTHQVRMEGSRLQAWQFDANQFKTYCGMLDS